jgi:hypothetical protein
VALVTTVAYAGSAAAAITNMALMARTSEERREAAGLHVYRERMCGIEAVFRVILIKVPS